MLDKKSLALTEEKFPQQILQHIAHLASLTILNELSQYLNINLHTTEYPNNLRCGYFESDFKII